MFTRSSSTPEKLEPRTSNSSARSQNRASGPESDTKSVIGNDLTITGQGLKIIGRGVLQIDGELVSDVQAAEVIVGENGKVTGMVAGQEVVIRGKVSGIICAKIVALLASSEVEGDIHHMSLAMEQGALFEGRSRRAANESELNSVVNGKSVGRPTDG